MNPNPIKGGVFSALVIRIAEQPQAQLAENLARQVELSPGFYKDAPVVLDLDGASGVLDLPAVDLLRRTVQDQGLRPVGVQGGTKLQREAALEAGLPALTGKPAEANGPPPAKTLIQSQPVRSGSQIYARGGDLLVLAPVSAGAEIIADGNIHVYGPLRGRALAGASGDPACRIFCRSLEAELLAIAGRYLVSEAIEKRWLKQSVSVELVGEHLHIQQI
ncbi:septum site-determining protein MinC [Marinivivus vitaminiproducens]|uniref:septum site-determining protein MinC n=1 Tax=Marinivivus vitaminiproducens TaxID=3035935 RepID=UPI0027A92E9C|nr:septum site-determining protein MinC [Geminicoccaceae bacterium SCSIO 64248]